MGNTKVNIRVKALTIEPRGGVGLYDSIQETIEFCLIRNFDKAILIHNSKEYVIDIEKIVAAIVDSQV